MWCTNDGINLYWGEPKLGDRKAMQSEIDTYNESLVIPDKWIKVDEYMSNLTVTSDVSVGGNKFNVSPQGIINIQNAARVMNNTSTKVWVEDWATFNTNLVEMEWVLAKVESLRDAKIVEVGLA